MKEEEEDEDEEEKATELDGDGESILRRCIHLISSLITISHSVKAFSVKWQLIRDKLHQLFSGLSPALDPHHPPYSDISPVYHLASSLLPALRQCRHLARRCSDLSYSGKLLMQSDLDVIAAKFAVHLKTLSAIYSTGILAHASALVVSRPGPAASRDDLRFYVRDLFTRLKIGDSPMRIQALTSLNEVLFDGDQYVRVVAETPDLVALLSNLLDRSDPVVQEKSAEAVSAIAGFDACKALLVGAGTVAPLVRVLEVGSDFGKESAARALLKLTENSDNAWLLSAHGGVTVMLKICSDANAAAAAAGKKRSGELAGSACGILRNLVGVDEIKKFMVEEGAVSALVGLLTGSAKDEVLQVRAMELLQTMAAGDDSVAQLVVREGIIEPLVRALDPNLRFTWKTRETALRAIDSFCFSPSVPRVNVALLLDSGFLERVLFFTRNREVVSIQEAAVRSASRLCRASEDARRAMGDAGFMPELLRLLDSKSLEVREMAAEVLWSLFSVPRNRRRFVEEESNVVRVLELLDPEEEKQGNRRKLLLSVLVSFTNSSSGRKRIAASGYLKKIERLADTQQVPEAKRVLRRLSGNRFTSLLTGIWHK